MSTLAGVNPALYVAITFIYLAGLIWLANDVNDRWGQEGCIPVAAFYFVFWWMFPVVLIVYIILRQCAYHPFKKGGREPGERDPWAWRSQGQLQDAAPVELADISPAERDERIDALLTDGKREEALKLAQEMRDTARGFGDEKGVERYTKYAGYIRRGAR
jgi:hypothetical protein